MQKRYDHADNTEPSAVRRVDLFATFISKISSHQRHVRSDGKRWLCDSAILCEFAISAHDIVKIDPFESCWITR